MKHLYNQSWVRLSVFVFLIFAPMLLSAQASERPKLVVGIVVDQMRQEYLYRFEKKFGNGGFRRIISNGYMLTNAHYNYVPTETGPGHASIYTGTTPAIHGIVANDWYDRSLKKEVNCVGDPNQKTVGSEQNGMNSPWRLLSTTVTDELKISTQQKAKVVGISWKDRGAILPAGHNPDGAYWFDGKSGNFVTSTYYKTTLPDWVTKFNSERNADRYLNQEWTPLLGMVELYKESGPDESPYETRFKGKPDSKFPYQLNALRKENGDYEVLGNSTFGNNILADFAKAALVAEGMGEDDITDFLSLSFSSTDKVGHRLGPNAVEVEDMYLRLDQILADFLTTLDKKIGENNYTVFITADHGVADVAQYMRDIKIPAGYFSISRTEAELNDFLKKYFPDKKVIEKISSEQVYFNQEAFSGDLKSSGIDLLLATELVTKFLMNVEGVARVYPESTLRQAAFDEEGIRGKIVRGYYPKRCGDIAYVLEPNWIAWGTPTGTGHGSAYSYDTHIPMLFFGKGINQGKSASYHAITDIAPTLSLLMKVKFPSGCTGNPIEEVLK